MIIKIILLWESVKTMKIRHYIKKKATLKRVLMFAATILLTIVGSTVGEKYNKPITPINYTQQLTQQRLVINNDVRRASNMKHISLDGAKKMTVGATAYCGDTITSTGVRPIEGTCIAVDPKVIPYGTKVYIPAFNRVFIAQDCGSAIKGNRIDIFMNDYNRCMQWGYRDIEIYILKD
jgi:3D (Asp-Asp-Asp) domain-containing protein